MISNEKLLCLTTNLRHRWDIWFKLVQRMQLLQEVPLNPKFHTVKKNYLFEKVVDKISVCTHIYK